MSAALIRHEETLRPGTPGVLSSVMRFAGAEGARVAWNHHCPLQEHHVPAMEEMIVCVRPSGGLPDSIRRSWGGKTHESQLGAGSFLVQPSGMPTRWSWSGSPEVINIILPDTLVVRYLGETHRPPEDREALAETGFRSTFVAALAEHLWKEGSSDPLRDLRADHLLQAMIHILFGAGSGELASPARGGLAPWQERRCTEYLRDNMAEDVELATLAGVANLSPFHFARMFKKSLGVPPHRYQLLLRLERAKALLVETEMSILQIALAVGYDSPQTLARLFQRELGVTPSAYRRERKS